MTRYPAYRDSGVEWLGEVPEGWTIVPVKAVATCNDEVLTEDTDPGWEIEYLEISGVDAFAGITETSKVPFGNAASRARRRVKDGDILVSTVRTYLRAIAQVIEPPQNMIASTGFAVLRPRSVGSRFLGYLFRSEILIGKIIARSVGVSYPAINASDIMSLPIPLPPLPEQTAIAAFLDVETAKIDGLVAEQRRLIDLLREKRQAVISHAVTRGLNPTAPLKPSGIDWLGDVPSHWTAPLSFKRVADRVVVGIAEAAAYAYVEVGVPILRSMNVRAGRIIGDLLYLDPAYSTDRDSKVLYAGDLITVRTGHAGVTAVIPQNLDGCQCFTMLITTLKAGMSPQYFCYWMNSLHAVYYFGLEAWGSAQPNISVPILQDIPVFAPPIEEQIAIALFLDETTAKLDTLTITAESAIALLEERRAALISAAVTGKIDVRPLMDKGSHAA